MSRFKKGETSPAVRSRQDSVGRSLVAKSLALSGIAAGGPVPESLPLHKGRIVKGSVHQWHDVSLGVTRYARNSAYQPYHRAALENLLAEIDRANTALKIGSKSKSGKSKKDHDTINELRNEIKRLTVTVAEVYRAYMHLVSTITEKGRVDDAYHTVLKSQSALLGRARLKVVE